MDFYAKHSLHFAEVLANTLNMMLGTSSRADTDVVDTENPSSDKNFHVGIYFTGMVYGEYFLSMDETVALSILGLPSDMGEEGRGDLKDAFSEILNTAVGEAITGLRETYKKLTFAAPRITFGKTLYPNISSSRSEVITDHGNIECHFYLDAMRLELATSYEEVMQALVTSNKTLEKANTQLKEQQSQLLHAEKMASLGVMAAGIAHEINNPLAFVNSNFNTLESYVDTLIGLFDIYKSLEQSLGNLPAPVAPETKEPGVKEHLDKIGEIKEQEDMHFIIDDTRSLLEESKEGLDRIKHIISGLREFSHVDGVGRKKCNINDIIENTISLVSNQIKYNSDLEKRLEELPEIVVNPGELSQVLANLLINASHAIEKQGIITITSSVKNEKIVLSVKDTGKGIKAEHLNQIFNPFFTTKDVGQGTGLGLSISHSIIKNHGGNIEVRSKEGEGTEFLIYLPIRI